MNPLADQFVDELQHDEQFEDLKTMDDINAKFVATVVERQHADTLGQFDVASPTGGADDDATECDRTFEDEFGEDLLQDFMHNRLSSSEPKDATNQTEPSSSSTSTQSRNIMLSESQIDYALTNWKRGLEKSLEACVAMANHLRSFETSRVEATLSNDVSLLIHDKSTEDSVDVSYVSLAETIQECDGTDYIFGRYIKYYLSITFSCYKTEVYRRYCYCAMCGGQGTKTRKGTDFSRRETVTPNVHKCN